MPDVPIVAEPGLNGFEMVSWYGLWGPAKLPTEVTSKIQREVAKALSSDSVKRVLGEWGFIASGSATSEFKAYIKEEHGKYRRVITEANIKIE